jgi:hypothetical protein
VGYGVPIATKKNAKKSEPTKTKQAEPKKKFSFFFLAVFSCDSILSPTPVYLKILYLCLNTCIMKKTNRDNKVSDYVDGLYVKNGRLINGREPGMSGIQQAANIKRIIDEDRKIKMIADGIERAEIRKEMRKDIFG